MLENYDRSKEQNITLKCVFCKLPFDQYRQPKYLPCLKTICSACVLQIENESINNKFKCGVCIKYHYIPEDGFPLNNVVYKLTKAEPINESLGKEYERLQLNLNKIDSLARNLIFESDNGINIIKKHCMDQIALVQLCTDNKIKKINESNKELIEIIKNYEIKCIQSFLNKNDSIIESMNKLIYEANIFTNEKQEYLNKYKINDEEIREFNKLSNDLKSTLNEEKTKLKSSIFNNELIKFQSNNNQLFLLGSIQYERLFKYPMILSASSDQNIILWDLEKNDYAKIFKGHSDGVLCVKQANRSKIISGSCDGSIKIWNIETGICIKTINHHKSAVYNIEIVSNDRFVSCSGDESMQLFDLNTFELIRTFKGHEDGILGIDKISNEKIVSCSFDKTLRVWDLNLGECLKILKGHSDFITCVKAFSDKKIISGSSNEIKVWNVESGSCLNSLRGDLDWIRGMIRLSDDKMASCDQSGKIKIWNMNTAECLKTIQAHSSSTYSLAKISNDLFLSCSKDKTIKLWNFETGNCVKTLRGHEKAINFIEILNK